MDPEFIIRERLLMKSTTENTEVIEQKLVAIAQQLLAESGEEYAHRTITSDASLQRHLGIDSLGRAELFQRIEKNFDVQLPDRIIGEAETLQDIARAIAKASPREKIQIHEATVKPIIIKSAVDPTKAKTLIDLLVMYTTENPDKPHIYVQDEQGKEELITHGKLLELSQRVAQAIIQRGIHPGETIAIMQPTNPGFFYTFFGILLAGCVPVPIYPPFRMHQIESYAKQEATILRNAGVRMLVTFQQAENLSHLLRAFVPSLKEITTVDELLKTREKADIVPAQSGDFALIQYTSGSTSAPKGVLLTHQNLLANVRAYGKAIKITEKDVAVSWVPLYHDLGLIGMWFGSLYHGVPLVILSPLTFLNRPERWLWAIHYHRGTISAGPNFAYELCARKIDPATIEGLDLSCWRLAINGAEAVQPKTLERFSKKFAAHGFKPETFVPVYGLAESTVGVTASPPGRTWRVDQIDRKTFEEEHRAVPTSAENQKSSLEFVSCGPPLPEHEVRIVDGENKELPERHVGMLQFKGPSSMQGYYSNTEATRAIYHEGGWWDSGDFAYLADGEAYITGRRKDIIIKAGRNLYPTEIEELTSSVSGIRQGCVIAFGISDVQKGTEKLIVVAETNETKEKEREQIRENVIEKIVTALDIVPDQVVLVKPRIIPKTSSGKLQRSACKNMYLEGQLTKTLLPAWAQIAKLGAQWAGVKIKRALVFTGKLLFTAYVAVFFLSTLPIILLCLQFLPRNIAANITRFWARNLFRVGFSPVIVTGQKNISHSAPLIYAANHTSYLDALLLISLLPTDTRFVGKKELRKVPVLRTFMHKLDHIFVDRFDFPQGVEDAKQMENILHEGHPILIFPEGTFSYAEGLRPFKPGTFKIAAETGIAVCPVAINGTRPLLRGTELLFRPGIIKINFGEPIRANGNDWQDITQLRTKVRLEIAKHCGEPTLDLITAGSSRSASKKAYGDGSL